MKQRQTKNKKIRKLISSPSNTIFSIDNKYLMKQFDIEHKQTREHWGLQIFSSLCPNTPMMLGNSGSIIMSEFFAGYVPSSELVTQDNIKPSQIENMVAYFVSKTYWSYRFSTENRLVNFPELKWEYRIKKVYENFSKLSYEFKNIIGETTYKQVLKKVKQIKNTDIPRNKLSMLHRDLHLGNVLCKLPHADDFKIIDFEHCMEGPIELEFQNSLLWNDHMSLNIDNMRNILEHAYRISYDKDLEHDLKFVYFADQINLAIEEKQFTKVNQLVGKFNT